ncbi:MAG: hypothetical protein GIW94_11685 [Candidatus Eremiobacteraeota bacterium]|nr:hypothetical protein [Candidatus Eremiobacteraeota bacterium]MBC5822705.1 hypothetical protein [Candidatus Eremiobacteraeota bacterium]
MAPFRFCLQPALDRAHEGEREARVALVRAQVAFTAVDADVNDLRLRMEAVRLRKQTSPFLASAGADREACVAALDARRRTRATEARLRAAEVEHARQGCVGAARGRSALERLRKHAEADYAERLARADAADDDEANALRGGAVGGRFDESDLRM